MKRFLLMTGFKIMMLIFLFLIAVPLWLVILIFRRPSVLAGIVKMTGDNLVEQLEKYKNYRV
jgi:hypothetical protein